MNMHSRIQINLTLRELLLLLVIIVLIITTFSWTAIQGGFTPTATPSPLPATNTVTSTQTATASATPTATLTVTPSATVTPRLEQKSVTKAGPLGQGLMILSLEDGGYAHLFAYQPETLPLTRLTDSPWDDFDPAINPEGTRIAFSSRKNGYWDLYLLDLTDGSITRLTDTPAYDGSPSWSPDGQWLAYESYQNNTLDIFITPVYDHSQAPIQLTSNVGLNYAPSWSPQGRLVAFISNRTGEPEVWMADLDRIEDRFTNISSMPQAIQSRPTWASDGMHLAWVAKENGVDNIYTWERQNPGAPLRLVGSGDWPVWSPDGSVLVTRQSIPNQTILTGYNVQTGSITLSSLALPGTLHGMDWKQTHLPAPLPKPLEQAARLTPTALWTPLMTPGTPVAGGRYRLVDLKDVSAPTPKLLDRVDESFKLLRTRIGNEISWDFFASLENAFVPLNGPLPPGMSDDWLYTGRSIAVNPVPTNAGWMVIVREDYGSETYWRVYLRARYQDGSEGRPITQLPWDLNARYSGDPLIYEQGGAFAKAVPPGYWLDFTGLAAAYGWERLPALLTWRTYYPAIRANQFVLREGLDWQSAMLQVYPKEILITPTPILPPTSTPSKTPPGLRPRTATPTRTPTITSTPRPTWTPLRP